MRLAAGVVSLLFIAFLRAGFAQEVPGYTVREFLTQTTFAEVAVSPTGKSVVFITVRDSFEKDGQETTLWRAEVDAAANKIGEPRSVVSAADCGALQWSPNGQYLSFVCARRNTDTPQLYVLDSHGGEPIQVTDSQTFTRGIGAYDWTPDAQALVFCARSLTGANNQSALKEYYGDAQRFPQEGARTNFYRLQAADFSSRKASLLSTFAGTVGELRISPDGRTIAFISGTTNVAEIEIHLLAVSGKEPEHQLTRNFAIESRLQWSEKGDAILVNSIGDPAAREVNYTQVRLNRVDLATGELKRLAPDFSGGFGTAGFGNFIQMPDHTLLAIGVESTTANFYIVSTADAGCKRQTGFRGMVSNLSASNDRNVLVFVLTDSKTFQELYLARGSQELKAAARVTNFNAELDKIPAPAIETIRWSNGEGDDVEGVLYWPPGKRGAKSLPLVVDIHGGPWSMRTEALTIADLSYAYYPALLASRGYLVLEPNFRGSVGRGDPFLKGLEGRSCSAPSTDILKGVEHLIASGWADANRMGVMGTSFGGQVTNCLITRSTRFRAACSGSGVWNDVSYFGTADNTIQNDIRNAGKAPWEDARMYWEESPVSGAGNVRTPTLITIGGADRRVPTSQAQEMYRALSRGGVPCELLIFPGEGHVLSKPSHRRTKVEAELAWLDYYLLGKPRPKFD